MKTMEFESIEVKPNTLKTGDPYIIRVKVKYIHPVFRFPLSIPRIIGIIFQRKGKEV